MSYRNSSGVEHSGSIIKQKRWGTGRRGWGQGDRAASGPWLESQAAWVPIVKSRKHNVLCLESPEVRGLEIIPNNRVSRKACQRQFCHQGSALMNEEGCYCIRRVGAQLHFLFKCVGHSLVSPAAGLSLMREEVPCWM